MRYITFNCHGAFRKKYERLASLDADVYIVQECEDPARSDDANYRKWAENHLWIGLNKNKGLGVFAAPHVKLKQLDWPEKYDHHEVRYFLPCMVNDAHQLLAVWAHLNDSPTFGYIGQLWKYLELNLDRFENMLIAGDLNSNVIWDKWDRWWNHSDVLRMLSEKQVKSLYHLFSGEEQGKESVPTFHLHRNPAKAYHIDYFFGSPDFQRNFKLEVGRFDDWKDISDHVPLMVDV